MDLNDDIRFRLRELRKFYGMSQTEFANKIGLKQNHLSAIENGHNNINVTLLKTLGENLNVNLNWLISGTGNMFYEGEGQIQIDDIINKLVEYKKQVQEG